MSWLKMKTELLDWIFPVRCPVCDRIVMPKGALCCEECEGEFVCIKDPRCLQCGRQIQGDGEEYCGDCKATTHVYDAGYALYEYSGVRLSIYRFKYGGKVEYVKFYGRDMERCLGSRLRGLCADALIPVPLHKLRQRRRGYNQAEVLADEISMFIGIPVLKDYVVRNVATPPLKEMAEKERQNNLKKAFKIVRDDVKLKVVIIVDDIYTTGTTIDALAGICKAAHVEKVYYVALSIGVGL